MMTGWIAAEEEAEAGDTTGISRFVYLGDENDGTMAKRYLAGADGASCKL